jgi:hypothetical protein
LKDAIIKESDAWFSALLRDAKQKNRNPAEETKLEKSAKLLRESLKCAKHPSVDAFLEYRSELVEVGKTCIAYKLIMCERQERLFQTQDNDWYEDLLYKLDASNSRRRENCGKKVVGGGGAS